MKLVYESTDSFSCQVENDNLLLLVQNVEEKSIVQI